MLDLRSRLPADQRRLLKLFGRLGESDRATLIAFAEFLAGRKDVAPSQLSDRRAVPDPIPRPAEESVVAAIKRLSQSYFMLDREAMLSETSALMGAHVMQGRPAADVIDELEELFASHYRGRQPGSGD